MVLSAHRRFWMRFLCVAVACIGLTVVLRHLNFHELVTALARANYLWYFASALAYGFVFLPAAWRWHLALRAAGCEISWATSLKFTLIGHFLYAVFFGAVGGDTGKSVLYARWRGFPIPSVLAAAP